MPERRPLRGDCFEETVRREPFPAFLVRAAEFVHDSVEWGKVIERPVRFALVRLGLGRMTLRFRTGLEVPVDRRNLSTVESLVRLAYSVGATLVAAGTPHDRAWHVSIEDGTIETPNGVRLALASLNPAIFDETFGREIHFQGFDLTGRTVVDAGAFVGDSALYFAAMGASVIAYEPDPANFRHLVKNLSLNPRLAPRVRAVNAAVGGDGEVAFQSNLGGASGVHATGGSPVRVRSISLATIFRENHLDRAFLLKADIKGAEFELVRQHELGNFDRLAIEYQTFRADQSPDQLVEAIRARGFTRMRVYHHGAGTYTLEHGGMIEAEKAD